MIASYIFTDGSSSPEVDSLRFRYRSVVAGYIIYSQKRDDPTSKNDLSILAKIYLNNATILIPNEKPLISARSNV